MGNSCLGKCDAAAGSCFGNNGARRVPASNDGAYSGLRPQISRFRKSDFRKSVDSLFSACYVAPVNANLNLLLENALLDSAAGGF